MRIGTIVRKWHLYTKNERINMTHLKHKHGKDDFKSAFHICIRHSKFSSRWIYNFLFSCTYIGHRTLDPLLFFLCVITFLTSKSTREKVKTSKIEYVVNVTRAIELIEHHKIISNFKKISISNKTAFMLSSYKIEIN